MNKINEVANKETEGIIRINNVPFTPIEGVQYKNDYVRIAKIIETPSTWQKALGLPDEEMNKITREDIQKVLYRNLVLSDLWFILYFVFDTPGVNRHFVIEACQEVENGGDTWTLDLWARMHYKSSIRKARNIQRLLKYSHKCQMIVSHTRPIAKKHLRAIMQILELNKFLHFLFPDVLYDNPRLQSPKWSEDDGIIEKGHQAGRPESSIEAWGVKEGMPISVHFDFIDIDDLETKDDVKNPDVIMQVRESVDLCIFLLTEDGSISYWGTPYSHEGVYIPHVLEKKKADGTSRYLYRPKPATDDGTKTGNPVLFSKEKLDDLFAELEKEGGEYSANCQLLINPTPISSRKLNPDFLIEIEPETIPRDILKFMVIDPAGDDHGKGGDSWANLVCGISPKLDDLGASDIYIMQALISPLTESEAPEEIARMYLAGGIIQKVGVEKVALSTTEIHVANALATRGRRISVNDGSLVILKPAGREKNLRILNALSWPLNNGKIHVSKSISNVYRERMRMEMSKFPYWKKDFLDALAYLYDMVKDADLTAYNATSQYNYTSQPYRMATICG